MATQDGVRLSEAVVRRRDGSACITSSILLFHGLEDMREGTIAAMLLISTMVRTMSTAIHAEKRLEFTSRDE